MSSYQEIAPETVEAAKVNQEAFIELYRFYGQRVLKFLIFRTGNVEIAEDLTQETFITLLSKLNTYQNTGAKFSSWLLQIAMNQARMHFRKKGNATPDDLEGVIDLIPNGKSHQVEWLDFFLAMQKLSEEDQHLLNLKFVHDLSNQDIAETLHISSTTCAVQIHRALTHLQQQL